MGYLTALAPWLSAKRECGSPSRAPTKRSGYHGERSWDGPPPSVVFRGRCRGCIDGTDGGIECAGMLLRGQPCPLVRLHHPPTTRSRKPSIYRWDLHSTSQLGLSINTICSASVAAFFGVFFFVFEPPLTFSRLQFPSIIVSCQTERAVDAPHLRQNGVSKSPLHGCL